MVTTTYGARLMYSMFIFHNTGTFKPFLPFYPHITYATAIQ